MKCQQPQCPRPAIVHLTLVRDRSRFDEVHLCEDHEADYRAGPGAEPRSSPPAPSEPLAGVARRHGLVRFALEQIHIHEVNESQKVLLREVAGERRLWVSVGLFEAVALDRYVKRYPSPRPLTHTLTVSAIEALDGCCQEVVIYDSHNGTFFTTLNVRQHEALVPIHMRCSDALCISAICELPIWVAEKVLDRLQAAT
jgi:bifunctional DNase/RNase